MIFAKRFTRLIALATASLLLMTGCSLGPVRMNYSTDFQAIATKYNIIKPNPIYRDKHYNVAIGDYRVSNTNIDHYQDTRERFSIAKQQYSNTWRNFFYDRKLQIETVQEETFARSRTGGFSFDIDFGDVTPFQSSCDQIQIRHNVETRKDTLFKTNKKKQSGPAFMGHPGGSSGGWQQSNVACILTNGDGVWELNLLANTGKKPLIELKNEYESYQLIPMFAIRTPGTLEFNVFFEEPLAQVEAAPGFLYGYLLRHNGEQIAAASTQGGNNAIWIKPDASKEVTNLMLGVFQTLIMIGWLDDIS